MPRWRAIATVLALVAAVAALAAAVIVLVPRNGQVLPDGERARLLDDAGLPADFPIHPEARRMTQPDLGGFSYAVDEPVPDVVAWYRMLLPTAGYSVFNMDLEGSDEFRPRWIYFYGRTGAAGAILVRDRGRPWQGTEVKVLSSSDVRLTAPTAPAGSPPTVIRP
jgi:hypothetical protein